MNAFFQSIAEGATPAIGEFVDALGGALPYITRLADTPQDPGWHAEGDVFIHTGMVLDALYAALASDASSVTGDRRTALILGAAFHDIAKPVTTREREIGGQVRVVAPQHEMRGRSYLATRLMDQGLPYAVVDTVLGLVGYHIDPKLVVVRDHGPGRYLRLSRCADPELLYWLELADMRGRECVDKAKQVENIELFRMLALEHGALQRFGQASRQWRKFFQEALSAYDPAVRDVTYGEFVRDIEAERITDPHEGLARHYKYREGVGEVVVLVGPSGSGKTTWARTHLGDHTIISLDDIRASLGSRADQSNNARVVQVAKERLKEQLRKRGKVVWDATTLRRDFRSAIVQLALDYKALVTTVCFHQSAAQYAGGDRARDVAVGPDVLTRQIDSMQWPEVTESHRQLIIGAKGTVLAYYGGVGDEFPYGLASDRAVLRESG